MPNVSVLNQCTAVYLVRDDPRHPRTRVRESRNTDYSVPYCNITQRVLNMLLAVRSRFYNVLTVPGYLYLHDGLSCVYGNFSAMLVKCCRQKTPKRQCCHHAEREGKNCVGSGQKRIHFAAFQRKQPTQIKAEVACVVAPKGPKNVCLSSAFRQTICCDYLSTYSSMICLKIRNSPMQYYLINYDESLSFIKHSCMHLDYMLLGTL